MKEAGHIITIADKGHIGIVKFLLDGNKPIFGFIPRAAIEKAVGDRELIVGTVCHAGAGDGIDGFCRFHKRLDGWITIYEIFVLLQCRRMGLGRCMIEALDMPLQLKCPVDSPANEFYKSIGFCLACVEPGKNCELNVWKKV